jgi:hypothetical protein
MENLDYKRNQSSLGMDESYHLFQVYQQQGENLQKCITPIHYPMNNIQQTPPLYPQHSVRIFFFFHLNNQSFKI